MSKNKIKSERVNSEENNYDVEQSWIAPGFSIGFGYLESVVQPLYSNGNIYAYKTYPMGLIEPDGTRRDFYCKQTSGAACLAYETSDGSFIKISGQVINSNPANATFTQLIRTERKPILPEHSARNLTAKITRSFYRTTTATASE